MLGIDEVFVYVVEVSKEDVSPENEIVQGLGLWIEGFVAAVQDLQLLHPLCGAPACGMAEKICHGVHLRRHRRTRSRSCDLLPQVMLKEPERPAVGKHKTQGA